MLLDHLEIAERHVAQGRSNVEHQRQLVQKLTRDCLPTEQPEELLALFEELLASHIADRDRLLNETRQEHLDGPVDRSTKGAAPLNAALPGATIDCPRQQGCARLDPRTTIASAKMTAEG
jgi:hypothetical protein